MGRVHLFADESGNMDFSPRGTKYFILTTITLDGFELGDTLLQLRRSLGWAGLSLPGPFHATEDEQAVRDRVFATIQRFNFRIDATIIEKAKVQDHLRGDEIRFYKTAWYLHMKHVAPAILPQGDEFFAVSATLGTKAKREQFGLAVNDVIRQTCRGSIAHTAAWDASSEPCLQAVDYCSWAIQRKWERGDSRSYNLISDKIKSEYDIFKMSTRRYY